MENNEPIDYAFFPQGTPRETAERITQEWRKKKLKLSDILLKGMQTKEMRVKVASHCFLNQSKGVLDDTLTNICVDIYDAIDMQQTINSMRGHDI